MTRRPPQSSGRPADTGPRTPGCPRPRAAREGFALLITITLVAFLVLILVSLAALTRVETQVAANSQQLSQARQNALMALNIAVGELQKYTGPDQRTTARADLEHGADAPNPHWVGAYGSSVAADYDDTPSAIQAALTNTSNVDAHGSSARLINWLVSGNEQTDFDPRRSTGDVGDSGQITTSPTGIRFSPDATISGLTVSTPATSTDITLASPIAGTTPGRLLVGGNSVDSALDDSNVPADYVVAPAVDIQAEAPGQTGPVTIGRYAWWVGDEGAKARVNLPLAGTDPSLTSGEQLGQKRRAFASASRAAVELMVSGVDAGALDSPRIAGVYDPGFDSVADVVTPTQTIMGSDDADSMAAALKHRFHDVTASSLSVLSDTYAGGLRHDLTRILANDAEGPDNTDRLWVPDNAAENTTFIPSWGHLRSHYATTATAGVITPRRPVYDSGAAGEIGVYPILTYTSLGFSFEADATVATDTDGHVPEGTSIRLNVYPVAVLWNPYNKRMAGRSYEIGVGFMRNTGGEMMLQVDHPDPATPTTRNWVDKISFNLRDITTPKPAGTDYPVRYFRFRVECPALEAGESLMFTLGGQSAYLPGTNTMLPGLNSHNYASIDTGAVVTAEDYRHDFQTVARDGLRNGQNGHTAIYLGEAGATPSAHNDGDWDHTRNAWYQTIQRVDYAAIDNPGNILASAAPLPRPSAIREPDLKWFTMSIFSAIGRGYVLNDQYGAGIPRYRWIAQGNIRAPYLFRTRRDPNHVTPYYSKITTSSDAWPVWFLENTVDFEHASAGISLDRDLRTGRSVNASLFEVREAGQPLMSIAHLQHANLSLAGSYPAYPVGNAIADFRILNTNRLLESTGSAPVDVANRQMRYYDASWLLNRTLWDRYFFSTVPVSGNVPQTLDNPRLVRIGSPSDSELQSDADAAASHLLLAGGFNINSTSEQAWRAVLGGLNQLAYDPETNASGPALGVAFSRFLDPDSGPGLPSGVSQVAAPSGTTTAYGYYEGADMDALWKGYRVLSPEQIAQLARNLVAEIRARGPFVSLADFVNRRLVDNASFVQSTAPYAVQSGLTAEQKQTFLIGMKGALQAAIDATPASTPTAYASNDFAGSSFWGNTRTIGDLPPGTLTYYSLPLARGDVNDTPEKTPQRASSANAPKFLTQADVLAAIGGGLSARSDTFTVRAYGESVNPVNETVNSQAWCEAVVQRMPDYVEDSLNPADTPADGTLSQRFGRQYKIVSFRWLSPSDI